MSNLLPDEFAVLEPFAAQWMGETAAERARLRDEASTADAHAFYECVRPLAARALDYLDRKRLTEFDERENRLMHLMLAFAHVAMAVEVQREDESKHAKLRRHMRIVSAPADAASRGVAT